VAVTPTPAPDGPEIVYGAMRWNTPLSEDHADRLLELLDGASGPHVLDLGCGWGELLVRAVARVPEGRGTGVDQAEWGVRRGRRLAAELGLSHRVTFVVADASAWADPSDRVICIGASHAWGGARQALHRLESIVPPGGRLVFGDGCWETPPTQAAVDLFEDSVLGLSDLVDAAMTTGWRVLDLSTADQQEWDEFESGWRAGRERWLQSHGQDPRADEVKALLEGRLREYLNVYRGVLGFAYLVLSHPPA
jgi:SAM-dependent methyltransferase